jgi:tetratricopeptide (TPR) repeat protein
MRPQSLGEAGPTPGADAKSDAGDVRGLIEQAQRLVNDGDANSARALVDKIAPRLQQSVDPAATADALGQLGALQSKLANHAVALQHYERAQALWHEAGDAAREARAWLAVGDARRALNRLPKAIEAYRAAALAGAKLDDPLVQAHAAFKLGHLAAARSPEATQQELTRAASLYAEADVRAGTSGLRIANPHLPDPVDDLDAVEPWIMSKVAERDLQRLLNATETVRQEKAVEVKATAHKPAAHNEWMHAGMILGGVTLVFIGVILLGRFLPAWSIRAEKVPFLLVAPVAGVIAWFLVRSSDIHSSALKHGVPIAVALLVYIGGFLTAGHNAEAARQDRLWSAVDGTAADLPAGASGAAGTDATRKLYARTLAMYEEQGNNQGQADILRTSAELELSLDQVDRALDLYTRSQTLYRNIGSLKTAADVSARMGDVLRTNHRFGQARDRYTDAAALYQQANNPPARTRMLQHLGDVERSLGQFDAARDHYLLALAQAQAIGDDATRVALLLDVAQVETRAARPERAREALSHAMTLAQERHNAGEQARTWLAIAQLDAAVGNGSGAQMDFEKAVDLAQAAKDPQLEARAWRARGDAERSAEPDLARQHYTLALQTAQQHKQRAEEARILLRLAVLDAQEKNLDDARARYQQATAIFQQLGKPVGQADGILGLGDIEVASSHGDAAAAAYRQALTLYEQAGSAAGQIAVLDRLARLSADSDPRAAQDYEARAATLRKHAEAPPQVAEAPQS